MRLDIATGQRSDIAFCPGLLRGLSIHKGHALVTVSQPREATFQGLPLAQELEARGGAPWCGALVVELSSGDIVEWMRFHVPLTELFDVAAMPGVVNPMAVSPDSAAAQQTITVAPT